MKKIVLYIILFTFGGLYTAQTYPLRTYGDLADNVYLKDTNNELPEYEGTWKTSWDNKTIFITFQKLEHIYEPPTKEYRDILIGRFKVIDNNTNQVLFDNTNLGNDEVKIEGGKFKKNTNKYSFIYSDKDLCGLHGLIYIEFTDATKTQLQWRFSEWSNIIMPDCPYYDADVFPQPLPKNAIFTKQ